MGTYKRIQRHYSFTTLEKKQYAITSIIFTLIMFLYAWRVTDINTQQGIGLLIGLAIISFLSLFVFIAGAKAFAITRGYTAHYTNWITGQLIGFLISFLSYGLIPILFPGLITIQTIERLRHGNIFKGENKTDIFATLSFASILPIFFSIVFMFLYGATQVTLFQFGAVLNGFLAFFSLLPFIKNNGLHMFYMNRHKYFILVVIALLYLIILLTTSLLMLIGVIVLAAGLWYLFMRFVVSKFW